MRQPIVSRSLNEMEMRDIPASLETATLVGTVGRKVADVLHTTPDHGAAYEKNAPYGMTIQALSEKGARVTEY